MIPTRTLVVWCPDWPVAAAGVSADVPAAVFQANRVVACSAAARAEGVKRGLRRREAQARCPDLVVLDHDHARDGRAFEPIVAAVETFAPRVEVFRPGVCLVPTRGPSRYFGGDEALAAKVRQAAMARSGHACLTGIADGPFAAVLAARTARIVAPGETPAFLSTFAVAALERPDLADILTRLGIRTLGQFAKLSPDDVMARFGLDGVVAHRLACGLDERPLATRTPPPDLIVQMELDPPAQRVDTAAFAGKSLADDLHHRLAQRGLACTRIAIEAETEHGERLSRLWRHEGALTSAAMAERVRWQLDGWLTAAAQARSDSGPGSAGVEADDAPDPTTGLTLLRLVPDEIVPADGRQLGFWGSGATGERAARALARVQGLLGPEAVLAPVVSGGRDAVEQITLVPWGDVREPTRPPPAPPPPLSPGDPPPPARPPCAPAAVPIRPASAPPATDLPAITPVPTVDPPTPAADDPMAKWRAFVESLRPPRPKRTSKRTTASEAPEWPGRLPSPAPTTVYPRPLPAQLVDAMANPVGVTGRHTATAPPARLSVNGGRWDEVAGWSGPWPVEERWWDPPASRRRARFQVLTASGSAYVLVLENGMWRVEALYD